MHRRIVFEVMEERRVLSACGIGGVDCVAFVVTGLGGADFPPRVVEKLNELNFDGFGQSNGFVSDWNSLKRNANPGSFGVQLDTIKIGGGTVAGISIPEYTIPNGVNFGVDIGTPNTNTTFVENVVDILRSNVTNEDIVVLIGHSLGGATVLDIARAAASASIEIDLLASLDPVGWAPSDSVSLGSLPIYQGINVGFVSGSSNDDGDMPGFRSDVFGGGLPDLPNNVKYFYNRWQTNAPFPLDYGSSGRISTPFSGDGGKRDLDADFSIQNQDAQNTAERFRLGLNLDSGLAFLSGRVDLSPVIFEDIEVAPGVIVTVPKLNSNFATSDGQFHGDFPRNRKIQDELIKILEGLAPQRPTADAGPDQAVVEGAVVTLDGSKSSDPNPGDSDAFTYQWQLISGPEDIGAPKTLAGKRPSFTTRDNGTLVYELRVTDPTGLSSAPDTLVVTVANSPPVISGINAVDPAVRGFAVPISTSFTDPGSNDTHTIAWDFGDGRGAGPKPATAGVVQREEHAYTHSGMYEIKVTVMDDDHLALGNGRATVSKTIEVKSAGLIPDPDDPSKMALGIGGTLGDDVVVVLPGPMPGEYEVIINGDSEGVFAPTGQILVAGQDGNDTITISPTITKKATIQGGAGDDTIRGGAGDDVILGGPGEDTMIGGGGDDSYDGGSDFDTILIKGTAGNDVIGISQESATGFFYSVNGDFETDTLVAGTVEQARIEAGDGADVIGLNIAGELFNAPGSSLRMSVHCGNDSSPDRLTIIDDGEDDLSIHRKTQSDAAGSAQIGPGNPEIFEYRFDGVETVQFVDESGNRINAADGTGSRLVVFKHDPFEGNDDRFNATHLGAGRALNVDPTIDPGPVVSPFFPADEDWYRVEADVTGTLDFQVFFEEIPQLANGQPGLPGAGNLDIFIYDADGTLIAGSGPNYGTNDGPAELDVDGDPFEENERIRIPAVQGQVYFLQVVGVDGGINSYDVTVLNEAPPTPFGLELDNFVVNPAPNPPGQNDISDTGRSQFDNVTYDDTPTLFLRLDDELFLHDLPGNPTDDTPPDEVIPIPFREGPGQPTQAGYAIAIFDEGATEQAGNPVQMPLGFATATAQEGVYQFTVPAALALSEGSHFLSARVQMIDPADPARSGFGLRSATLEVVVDVSPPAVSLGQPGNVNDGLRPESDSGVSPPISATLADRITRDTTPTFWGRAEADTIIRLYADQNGNGLFDVGTDVFIGQSTASPLHGTNQEPNGYWELPSVIELNDPAIFPTPDGVRTIFVTGEDVAGNLNAAVGAADTLRIFLDTVGPVVESVFISDSPGYNLFAPKPLADGPTPRVDRLTIEFSDGPDRTAADFLFNALQQDVAGQVGHYRLIGDHNGVIPIEAVTVTNLPAVDGEPARARVELEFASPLPDDRFTLSVADSLVDLAGNALDGENNAVEPQEIPLFATGDGLPGGAFVARFTVDSRPEFGTVSQGTVYVDINGNFVFDPEGKDGDFTNCDFVFDFGQTTDAHFAGNFAPAGAAASSGFDKLGVYGQFNGKYQFYLDTDDDGVGDFASLMPNSYQVNAIPVAGDFDPGHPGEEIGAFDGQNWYLDVNGNNRIDPGERYSTLMRGLPLVGDFNGDGDVDLATYNNDTGRFYFDLDGNPSTIEESWSGGFSGIGGFSGFGEKPLSGDFNLDGIDDIVMWTPGREGILPKEAGEFMMLLSDRAGDGPSEIFDTYSPAPLGNDRFGQFGDEFALPVFGNFDPPVQPNDSGDPPPSLTNSSNPLDIDGNGLVSPLDALRVVNYLNRGSEGEVTPTPRLLATFGNFRPDANRDGRISPLDALVVVNFLNRRETGGEGERASSGEQPQEGWAAQVDALYELEKEDALDAFWLHDELERRRLH